MSSGRISTYKPEYCEQAEKATKAGFTDKELGVLFGVSEVTINNWKKKHEGFSLALKRGKEDADENVKQSLYKTAMQGNPTAMIFWLKNRRPKEWRDRREIAVDTVDSPFNLFITGDKDDGDTT